MYKLLFLFLFDKIVKTVTNLKLIIKVIKVGKYKW